jgi:hypothetical protein
LGEREARFEGSNSGLFLGWLTTKIAEKLRIGLTVNKKGKTVDEVARNK